jgi:hypothetical protein
MVAPPSREDATSTSSANIPVDNETEENAAVVSIDAVAAETSTSIMNTSYEKEATNGTSTPTNMSINSGGGDSCYLGDIISQSRDGSLMSIGNSFDNRDLSCSSRGMATHLDPRPPRHTKSKSCVDGVQMMYDPVLSFPPPERRTVSPSSKSLEDKFSSSFQLDDNWSTAGGAAASRDPSEVGSSHLSGTSPRIEMGTGSLSEEKRCSPDKSILDLLDEDEQSGKSSDKEEEGVADDSKPYSHVSAAHEILNSFIALNPSPDRGGAPIEDRFDDETRKSSSVTGLGPRDKFGTSYTRKNSLHVITDLENAPHNSNASDDKSPTKSNSLTANGVSPKSPSKVDKKKLNERLRQRLAERNQRFRSNSSSEKPSAEKLVINTQATLPQKTHKRPASCSEYFSRESLENNSKAVFDAYRKYGIVPIGAFPDTVTFDSEDNESQPLLGHRSFRKSSSETGVSSAGTTPRPSIHRQIPPPHGIGILQPDGVVFDDALLLRLARQAKYSRLRGDNPIAISGSSLIGNSGKSFNAVKIHVYDLLQRDAELTLVEMPLFNCNFPIGQCFKVMNNAANCLGTGAYHVGVEVSFDPDSNTLSRGANIFSQITYLSLVKVNGIEYAFGANNIIGMSGVFTCPPKHSPGYEYRETLDFGNICTTKNTWIRIPKENALGRSISNALASSRDVMDREVDRLNTSTVSTSDCTFRQIESFADGNAVIHSMAKEYMGTDYDLLRKNCCTFAHDVCLRLGVKEEDIPSWFHNAAKAGADAEDAITNAEQTVKNMFDCANMEREMGDLMEGYNHGFEVIADLKRGSSRLKVVESPPVYHTTARQPLLDEDHSEFWETLS